MDLYDNDAGHLSFLYVFFYVHFCIWQMLLSKVKKGNTE